MASWQADGHGGAHGGVRDPSACSRTSRSGCHAGYERCGDRGAAPSTDGVTPAGRAAALRTYGPDGACHAREAVAAGTVAGLSGHARDAASVASRVGGPTMDVSRGTARSAGLGAQRYRPWSCGWRGRTLAGDICALWGSAASSASGCRRPRCAGFYAAIASGRHPAWRAELDCVPSGPKQAGCLHATSSRSRRSA